MLETLDQGNIVLGTASALLSKHDEFLGAAMQYRADFEAAMIEPAVVKDFEPKSAIALIERLNTNAYRMESRIVNACAVENFEEFRRLVTLAKNQLSVVAGYQDAIDIQGTYASIYKDSGSGPQNLEDENAGYDQFKTETKVRHLQTQYEYAVAAFLATVRKLEVEEPSSVIIPQIAVVGG